MTGPNRAERRRRERERRRLDGKRPTIIVGDNVVAAQLGHAYEARPRAELPDKVPGKHRWVATGAWVISEPDAAAASDPDTMKLLDQENLMTLAIGCWDCERALGEISPGGRCDA